MKLARAINDRMSPAGQEETYWEGTKGVLDTLNEPLRWGIRAQMIAEGITE